MKVFLYQMKHPLVAAALVVRVGWRHEPPSLGGISHFLEHACFGGSARYPDIEREEARLGVQIEGLTLAGATVFSFASLKEDFSHLLSVLLDMVYHPRLDVETIERERRTVAVASPSDYTAWEWARLKADDMVFETEEIRCLGDESTIRAIRREDLVEWHRRYYHTGNSHLLLAGDVEEGEVRDLIAGVGPPSGDTLPPIVRHKRGGWYYQEVREGGQPEMYVGFRFPLSEDLLLVRLLGVLLGNYSRSLLFRALRKERSLAYMVESGVRVLSDVGRFGIYVGVADEGREEEAWLAVSELLSEVKVGGVSDEDWEWAKRVFRFQLLRQASDPEKAIAFRMRWGDWGGEFPGFEVLEERLGEVTVEQLQRLCGELFRPERCFISVVGPSGGVDIGRWRDELG